MLDYTKAIISTALRGDSTIAPEQARAALDALGGKSIVSFVNTAPMDRVIPRTVAAQLLGVTERTVTAYAKRGKIRAVKNGAGGKRATGYSESSIRECLAGGYETPRAPDTMPAPHTVEGSAA